MTAAAAPARGWVRHAPLLFVLLWSTGFIGAKLGLPHAPPLGFLATRYAFVVALMAVAALWVRAPWPQGARAWGHLAVAGLLVHAVYLGGVFTGISQGLPAGVSSLVVGLQPLLTAVGAGYAEVWANSGRIANTIYLAPDRYGYLLGLTSSAFTQFTSVSGDTVGPLSVVVSRGMDSGVIVVGDCDGLLVAETPGAPVELRHEEHDGIRIPVGNYLIGRQVESAGAEERVVAD